MYTIDPGYVAMLEHDLDLMDTLAQEQYAAFEASRGYADGLRVLSTLQACVRCHATAFAELLACWQPQGAAKDTFAAGVAYGKLLASLHPPVEGRP